MTEEIAVTNDAPQGDRSLVQYGDTNEIKALGKRIRTLMPGGKDYTENEALMLAQLAIAHNLNPFNGEIWLIKNKKTGELLGAIIGIKGLRKQAKRQCDHWGVGDNGGFRLITDQEELKKYNSTPADTVYEYTLGDDVTQKRWLEGITSLREAKFDQNDARDMMGQRPPVTRGIGVYKSGEASKMKPNQCAMFRAEKDALKRRFDVDFMIPLPTKDGEVLSRDPAFAGMTAADYDEAMGIEEVDERDRLPGTAYDKPVGNMMGFDPDEVNGSVEVLDLEFEDDADIPSEPESESAKESELSAFSEAIKEDGTPAEVKPKAKGKLPPKKIDGNRPFSPKQLYGAVEEWVDLYKEPCSAKHRKFLQSTLVTMFDGDANAAEKVCRHLTGQPGALSMEDGYVQALLQQWMHINSWDDVPSNVSIIEGKSLLNWLPKEADQQAFDVGATAVEEQP